MMDWTRLQQQWQSGAATPMGEVLHEVQQRDRTLRAQLRRRDWLETGAALLVAPIFAIAGVFAATRQAWVIVFFCAFLTAWAAYVPWHLWQARRRLPEPQHDLALVDYLRQTRDAMLVQAQMLERIWVWYLAPCAFGVIGLSLATAGVTRGTLGYAAIVLAFCVFLAWLNRKVARIRFRAHADEIEQQLSHITTEIER